MSQDTRKDKRAKVVSLNVRYKSATVDEFIENHSHDVSKGGIFVKTPTPFPPGTLLKFEIRLAGDKSVISGVGRVVWKREPTQASPEKPAGMGVKFIKIDDASRAVIDRLIAQKADAGSAYTSDPAAFEEEKPGAGQPTTLRGIPAAAQVTEGAPAVNHPITAPAPQVAKPGAAAAAPPPAPTPAKPVPAPPSSNPIGGAKPAPKPATAAPASSNMAKTMPLGTSPFAAPKPSITAQPPRAGGPPAPIANKPATSIGIGPAPGAVAPPPAAATATAAAAASPPVAPGSQPQVGAAAIGAGAPPPTAPPAPRPPAVNARKATMMGVALPAPSSAPGADKLPNTGSPLDKLFEKSPAAAPDVASELPTPIAELTPMAAKIEATPNKPPPASTGASPMFPTGASEKDFDSVKEPTVMKQAAELLEEALREAGGSIDEIGQNPLFSQSSQRGGAVEEKRPSTPDLGSVMQSGDTLMMQSPIKGAHTPSPTGISPSSSVSTPSPSASVSPSQAQSSPPPSVQHSPPAKPLSESLRDAERDEKKKSGAGGLIAGLLVVAVLVGGGVYAYKSGMLASVMGETPTPSAAPTPTPSTAPTPSDSVATSTDASPPTDDAAAAAAGDGSAALATGTDAGGDAAASKDASSAAMNAADAGAVVAPVKPPPPPPPPPQPKPKPKPPPPPPPAPDPEGTTTAAPTPTPTPTPTTTTTTTTAPTATEAPAP